MISAGGTIERLEVIRLDPGEDVFEGLVDYCRKHQIRNGVILTMHGSLARAEYCTVSPRPDLSTRYGYTNPIIREDICELLSASGTITHEENGTINAHVHCCYGDKEGHVFGGHMVEGNKVLLVAEIVIGVAADIEMLGIRNETGGVLFTPQNMQK